MTESVQRRSLGGYVVEAGLAGAGYSWADHPEVALVETARPGRSAYETVLAQNAWNVIDRRTFWALLRKYPKRRWARYVSRRAIARVNMRRAGRVVCLTDAMGDLCRPYARDIVVSPVTVPVDFLDRAEVQTDGQWADAVLVPGTVTWHKDPLAAFAVTAQLQKRGLPIARIVFGGSDDGSECWSAVEEASRAAGLPASRQVLTREEMVVACASAAAVVVTSALESLSLSVAEALFLSPVVVASRIPAHVELAERLKRQPLWLHVDGRLDAGDPEPRALLTPDTLLAEWSDLGSALGLTIGRNDA